MSGVLMGNNLGTIHNAVADYSPDESRQIHRCPTMTSRFLMQTVHPKHAKKRALMQENFRPFTLCALQWPRPNRWVRCGCV